MPDRPPSWRQGFDAIERQVAPRLEALVQSDEFAVAIGLVARLQRSVQDQLSRTTRRMLHQLNLPAGSDVNRILHELGQLKRQVRELSSQLDGAQHVQAQRTPARKAPAKRSARGRPAREGG